MKRVLITGGAGFIGHHVVDYLLERTDWQLVLLDRLDTSGDLNRLTHLPIWPAQKARVTFVHHDLKAPFNEAICARLGSIDYIFHLAASTHVDRSISDPMLFVGDNVVGTGPLLEYARTLPALSLYSFVSHPCIHFI